MTAPNSPHPPFRPRWAPPLALAIVCLSCVDWPLAAGQSPAGKDKPTAATKVDIHRLTNEELFQQAKTLYDKAALDYLAQSRALAFVEALLDEVRAQTEALKPLPPSDKPDTKEPTAEDLARKTLDRAKVKQDLVQRQLKLVQAQKELLDRVARAVDGCRSAAGVLQTALADLNAFTLESELRVKDGTIDEAKVPDWLTAGFLEKKRRDQVNDLARLQTKAAETQKKQEVLALLLEATTRAALAADAEVGEASRNLVREQQRQELEKAYLGNTLDDMLAELARMVDEGIGLKGTYELALRKFDVRAVEAERARKELAALKQPDAKIPQLNRAEDVEAAAKAIQELIKYYTARTQKIAQLRGILDTLAAEGGEFEADAAVSDQHLFKMQVLANLLSKKGVPEERLPVKARAVELGPAAARQKKTAAGTRAATEKAKSELVLLNQQRKETEAAAEAAALQLANLKQSQQATIAALKWERTLKDMTAAQVIEAFTATRQKLAEEMKRLEAEAAGYAKATTAEADARARLDALRDPFLRTAEEQGQAEKRKLLEEMRKEAGLERPNADTGTLPLGTASAAPAAPANPLSKEKGPSDKDKTPPADVRSELAKTADSLHALQQLLAGRLRVVDERQAKKKDLLAGLEELEQKAAAYAKTLTSARRLAYDLNAAAVDLKKRFGMGDLAADMLPEGITDALRLEGRAKLDAAATSVLNALGTLQQNRDKLLQPDPDGDALAAATRELLALVGRRLDLLADLKRLADDYRRDKSARPPSESKLLEQLAADRQDSESSRWDTLLGIDASRSAKNLSELLASYYRELIEIEDKEVNVKKQREKMNQLIELAQAETAALARALPLLAKQLSRFQAVLDEETVLARARLRPDRAEEALKAHQAKTGRLLSKPVPVADKEKAEKIEEFSNALFEHYVVLEAAKKWDEVLAARAAPAGLKAEAGAYQDELSQLNAVSAANVRRIRALAGEEGSSPGASGEIGKVREELAEVRIAGVKRIGIKIGAIVLIALLLPRLLMWVLSRSLSAKGSDTSLVFSAFWAILKAVVWASAIAMILGVLGFDVTAIIAALGIGGLAVGLAAQPILADVIAAVVIFAERRFKIGDVIRLGSDEPARVVGLTWRSTQVKTSDGLVVTIPNRKVTEATIQNLTRSGGTFDTLSVSVNTQKDADQVLAVIRRALEECPQRSGDFGVSMKELNQLGETKKIKYQFWWLLADYETRNRTRDDVFARISASLAHEDLAGTEISLT